MKKKNVSLTAESGLCISCGMCKGVCPQNCITWKRKNGMYYPQINEQQCISCKICLDVCPGISVPWNTDKESLVDNAIGDYVDIYNAWSLDPDKRHTSASGGVVSTLVEYLLKEGYYSKAFCVDTYIYKDQLYSKAVSKDSLSEGIANSSFPKSRYLPISQEYALKQMMLDKSERIILIGTSCAVQGLLKAINRFKLNRDNYLIIGLFCERVFNYNVDTYFKREEFCDKKELEAFHFKNKESGGWPGNMKLFFNDGSTKYLENTERMKIKDYFMPERCLYCIDKLNVGADISLGDNYTGIYSSELGSNSVIIRSERGMNNWRLAESLIESHEIALDDVAKTQAMEIRVINYHYGKLKEAEILNSSGQKVVINENINKVTDRSTNYQKEYDQKRGKIVLGENYLENPEELIRQLELDKKAKERRQRINGSLVIRGINFIKRKLAKYV